MGELRECRRSLCPGKGIISLFPPGAEPRCLPRGEKKALKPAGFLFLMGFFSGFFGWLVWEILLPQQLIPSFLPPLPGLRDWQLEFCSQGLEELSLLRSSALCWLHPQPCSCPCPSPRQAQLSRILRIFPDPRKPIQSPLTSPLAPPPHLCQNFPAENHPTLFFFGHRFLASRIGPWIFFVLLLVWVCFFFFTFHLLGELKITRISHFLLISSQQLCPHCSWRSPCVSRLLP